MNGLNSLSKGRSYLNNFKYLYFLKFENFFKVGVSLSPQERMNTMLNQSEEVMDIEKSLYIKVNINIFQTVEKLLKNKYDSIGNSDFYPTECFELKYMDLMIKDVKELSYLFGLKMEVTNLEDKFVLIKNKEGKFRVLGREYYLKKLSKGFYSNGYELIGGKKEVTLCQRNQKLKTY